VQGFKTIFAKKLVIVLQKLCHNILIINALSHNQQLLIISIVIALIPNGATISAIAPGLKSIDSGLYYQLAKIRSVATNYPANT